MAKALNELPLQSIATGYGRLLAAHAQQAIAMHRRVLGVPVAVFSDQFSPYENAAKGDYAGDYPDRKWRVPGGWSGSWAGLDPEVRILNWSFDERSFAWYAEREHQQIFCGDYDWPADGIGRVKEQEQVASLLDAGIPLAGYCRFTWAGNYDADRLAAYLPPPELRARMG